MSELLYFFLENSAGFSISCEVATLRLSSSPAWVTYHLIIPRSFSVLLGNAGQSKTGKWEVIGGEMNQWPRGRLKPSLPGSKSQTGCSAGSRKSSEAKRTKIQGRGWQQLHGKLTRRDGKWRNPPSVRLGSKRQMSWWEIAPKQPHQRLKFVVLHSQQQIKKAY